MKLPAATRQGEPASATAMAELVLTISFALGWLRIVSNR
jgi:hypothetical protein